MVVVVRAYRGEGATYLDFYFWNLFKCQKRFLKKKKSGPPDPIGGPGRMPYGRNECVWNCEKKEFQKHFNSRADHAGTGLLLEVRTAMGTCDFQPDLLWEAS